MRWLLPFALLLSGCVGLDEPSASQPPLNEAQELYYEPSQCRTNPWQGPNDDTPERTEAEARRIRDYYAARDVTLHDLRFQTKYEAVCAACHCPRGDWIHAQVPADDVGRARELGWKSMHSGTAPTTGSTT